MQEEEGPATTTTPESVATLTAPPTASPTAPPTVAVAPGQSVDTTVTDIQVPFQGAVEMSAVEIVNFQTLIATWFDAYYNGDSDDEEASRQLQLLLLSSSSTNNDNHHGGRLLRRRALQQTVDPTVRNMNSVFDVTGQDTTTVPGTNTVTYTQSLSYEALEGAMEPTDYVKLPFVDLPYAQELADMLSNDVGAFDRLVTPIAAPEILPDDGNAPVATAPTASVAAAPTSSGPRSANVATSCLVLATAAAATLLS